jgi:hypothetical protein
MQDFSQLLQRLADVGLEFVIVGGYLVISLENLIRAKEALGREKDLLMAKELRAIAAKRRQGGPAV